MKVLIYEPGTDGHRPVYLRYIDEALREAGAETILVTDVCSPWALSVRASRAGAQWIFVCTLDGLFGWLSVLGLCCRPRGIRVAGIYYLFNNLYEGWKAYLWCLLLKSRTIHAIFVPDFMRNQNVRGYLRERIIQIPDPWDSRVLRPLPRQLGLQACGIRDSASCVFLVLGAISLRKGIAQLLWCAENWDYEKRPKFRLLIAGKVEPAVSSRLSDFACANPQCAKSITVIDHWLSDEEICQCYAAASYLCALYPKSFKVSISTVLRAFAVGRPVIAGDHGMIGKLVQDTRAGYTCDTASGDSLHAAFEAAYDAYVHSPADYHTMSRAGAAVAAKSELTHFKDTLALWVKSRGSI